MTTASRNAPATRSRIALSIATLVSSGLLAAQAIIWLILPNANPFSHASPVPIAGLLGPTFAAAVELGLGVAGLTVALIQRSPWRPAGAWLPQPAIAIVAVTGFGLLGFSSIAFAGYALVWLAPLAILASLALLARHRPWLAAGTAIVILGLVIMGQISGVLPLGDLALQVTAALIGAGVAMVSTISVIAFTGVWLLAATQGLREGPVSRIVLRHRVPITIAAAACCLPYVVCRLSWLTPWPLFGSPARFPDDQETIVLAMGLALGAAMALGGLLTLGLVLPWGERLPRWMGPVAGRPVPALFAVVPAIVVAALFTFSGIGLAIDGVMGVGPLDELNWTLGVVLPFWLWGPLLALSAWGYWLHRRSSPLDGVSDP